MKELLLYGYLWYHIREVFSFIGEFGGAISLNHQIGIETDISYENSSGAD